MFDLAWSEIALIAVVAVVVIGPKDLPDAIRTVAKGVQKLRRMATDFQSQADELVREAKLEDVRDQIRDIRNFDVKGTIEKHLDQDGDIRRTFKDDPLKDAWKPGPSSLPETPPSPGLADGSAPLETGLPVTGAVTPPVPTPPAFIPPGIAAERQPPAILAEPLPAAEPAAPEAPAMIPPQVADAGHTDTQLAPVSAPEPASPPAPSPESLPAKLPMAASAGHASAEAGETAIATLPAPIVPPAATPAAAPTAAPAAPSPGAAVATPAGIPPGTPPATPPATQSV